MINRENWLHMKKYLIYLERVKQLQPVTVNRARTCITHLLEWADSTPLTKARNIDPTFPSYLLTARRDGLNVPLSQGSHKKICEYSRNFMQWLRQEYPVKYKALTQSWLDTIKPARAALAQSAPELEKHEAYSLEDILKIAGMMPESLLERRTIAAACFMFLSGIRAGAFVTIPINCIDLESLQVKQLPSRGVRTKNSKAAITAMLNIPELLDPVRAWDQILRDHRLADNLPWFARLEPGGTGFQHKANSTVQGARVRLDKQLKALCVKANVTPMSPHKLRHGHAVYALKQAQDISQLKAVSQNLMHSSLVITDQIYSVLDKQDIHDVITRLGHHDNNSKQGAEIQSQLAQALKDHPELLLDLLKNLLSPGKD